jgi:hypothetical protein
MFKKFLAFYGTRNLIAMLAKIYPPLDPILSQLNPFQTLTTYFHFNIILPFTCRSETFKVGDKKLRIFGACIDFSVTQ